MPENTWKVMWTSAVKLVLSVVSEIDASAFQALVVVDSHIRVVFQHMQHLGKLLKEELGFRTELETATWLHRGIDQRVNPIQNGHIKGIVTLGVSAPNCGPSSVRMLEESGGKHWIGSTCSSLEILPDKKSSRMHSWTLCLSNTSGGVMR